MAGVVHGDAVEFLPVEIHLSLRKGREPNLSLRVGKDELYLHKSRDVVLADKITQVVLIIPQLGEEQLGVSSVQQKGGRAIVHLMEGGGDTLQMVFPPGVLAESIHSSDRNAEQKTSQQQA